MNNNIKSLLTLIFLVSSLLTFGKKTLFNVLIVSGNVQNITKLNEIKEGDKLHQTEYISLKKGAYIALLHTTGKTIEIQKSGKYLIDSLSLLINYENSYTSEYTNFVVNSFNKKEASAQKNYMNTGAVRRGGKLFLRIPNKTYFLPNQKINVIWTKVDKAESYQIMVLDHFAKVLYEKEVTDTNHILTLDASKNRYIIKVIQKGASYNSDQMLLSTYTNSENFQNLEKAFASKTAIDFLVKAKFYENKGLLLQAQDFYIKAKELQPNQAYQFQYYQFLNRNVKGI